MTLPKEMKERVQVHNNEVILESWQKNHDTAQGNEGEGAGWYNEVI